MGNPRWKPLNLKDVSYVFYQRVFRFVTFLRTILYQRLTLSRLQSPRNSLILRLILLIRSALIHPCNYSSLSPLLRSLNFFQLFQRSLVVWTTFLLPSLNNALLFSLTSLLTWLICPSVRALFRSSLSTLLSLNF